MIKDKQKTIITRTKKIYQPRILYIIKIYFKLAGELKIFPDMQNLKKKITSKNVKGSYLGKKKTAIK